jgi:L-malate glycosyltransferase
MRILYFSRHYTTHDRRFLLKMAESRHQILFLRLEDDGGRFEKRPLPDGVEAVEWPGGFRPARDASELIDHMPAFEEIIARVKPDLIHAGPVQTCGFMTALSGFHPFMIMSWGSDILIDADRDARMRWITGHALRAADYLVCDCDAVRDKVRAFHPLADDRVVQFPWGIDLSLFAPGDDSLGLRQLPGWEDGHLILSTRGWEPIYAIDALIDAFQLAHQQNPRLRLILLGGGSQAEEVAARIERHHLQSAVHAPGMISHAALPGYFRAADLYLSCTLSDGTSISLLEAFANGLPVVVTDAPGNREWVTPDVNGWLAPPRDVPHFAEKILHAASLDAGARARIADTNRELARTRADWNLNAARLIAAYDRIADSLRRT